MAQIEINNPDHLGDFIRLNEAWISEYFSLEKSDNNLSRDPEKILRDGGFVFSLVEAGAVQGVCALFHSGKGEYELARMAVAAESRGKGYANLLMQAAFNKLRELGASRVYLLSNTKLTAALSLYKKFGFMPVHEGTHPEYSRCNIMMECRL